MVDAPMQSVIHRPGRTAFRMTSWMTPTRHGAWSCTRPTVMVVLRNANRLTSQGRCFLCAVWLYCTVYTGKLKAVGEWEFIPALICSCLSLRRGCNVISHCIA